MHTLIIITFYHFKHNNKIIKFYNSVEDAIYELILFDDDTINEFRFLEHNERVYYTSTLDNACKFFKKYGYEFMCLDPIIIQSETEMLIKDKIKTKASIPDLVNDETEPKQVEHTYIRKEECRVVIPLILIDDGSCQSIYADSIDLAILELCVGSISMEKIYLKLSLKEKIKVTSSLINAYEFNLGAHIYKESDEPYFERTYYPFDTNYKLEDAPKPSKDIINQIDDYIEFEIKDYDRFREVIEPIWNKIIKIKF